MVEGFRAQQDRVDSYGLSVREVGRERSVWRAAEADRADDAARGAALGVGEDRRDVLLRHAQLQAPDVGRCLRGEGSGPARFGSVRDMESGKQRGGGQASGEAFRHAFLDSSVMACGHAAPAGRGHEV